MTSFALLLVVCLHASGCGCGREDIHGEADTAEEGDATAEVVEDPVAEPEEDPTDEVVLGCGNGILEQGEQCDEGPANSDTTPDTCRTDCTCPRCGDGVRDGGERCDGTDLGSDTCVSLGYAGGDLACTARCQHDGRGCEGDGECGNRALDDGEQCDDGNTLQWDGCNECAIVEFRVNTTYEGPQLYQEVDINECGHVVVTWTGDDEDNDGVFGRRYLRDGRADGSDFPVNTFTTSNQNSPSVALALDGRSVFAWHSGPGLTGNVGILGQRYDASGTRDGTEFLVGSTDLWDQASPSVSMTWSGRHAAAWESYYLDGDGQGIFGMVFDESGTATGPEFQVNSTTEGDQTAPVTAMDENGRFVVVWASADLDGLGIFAQLFGALGTRIGTEFQASPFPSTQLFPSVAMASDGRFVVVWTTNYEPDYSNIFAQQFDASGSPSAELIHVNYTIPPDHTMTSVGMDRDGRFLVAWTGRDGDSVGVVARRFDPTSVPEGPEFQVNVYWLGGQYSPSVAMAPDGKTVITWLSRDQYGDNLDIFAQRYDASGNPLGILPW